MSKTFGWVTVNPESGTGSKSVNVSGSAYQSRNTMRTKTLWFNPTNSTEVESVQFNIKQSAAGLLFDSFKQGADSVTLNNKAGELLIPQSSTSLTYSFRTNAKKIYLHVQHVDGSGGAFQITNISVNRQTVESATSSTSASVKIHEPANDPGASGMYEVSFTVTIGANTGTKNRKMVLFIAGANDNTSSGDFNAAYAKFRGPLHEECFANINITQKYIAPSVEIGGNGVTKDENGVYSTRSITAAGGTETFTITASDNLEWAISETKVTPDIEDDGDFDFGE